MSYHTKTMPDGRLLNVDKLLALVAHRRGVLKPLASLRGIKRSRQTGFSMKRYAKADLRFPIIADETGLVLDGRHRYFKALDAGISDSFVITASREEIEQCL